MLKGYQILYSVFIKNMAVYKMKTRNNNTIT